MKAILTLGGDAYLIPNQTDLAKILDLIQGLQEIREQHIWGPDAARYEDKLTTSRSVLGRQPARVRVELVPDADICTADEWDVISADYRERAEAFKAAKAAAALAAPVAVEQQPIAAGS